MNVAVAFNAGKCLVVELVIHDDHRCPPLGPSNIPPGDHKESYHVTLGRRLGTHFAVGLEPIEEGTAGR